MKKLLSILFITTIPFFSCGIEGCEEYFENCYKEYAVRYLFAGGEISFENNGTPQSMNGTGDYTSGTRIWGDYPYGEHIIITSSSWDQLGIQAYPDVTVQYYDGSDYYTNETTGLFIEVTQSDEIFSISKGNRSVMGVIMGDLDNGTDTISITNGDFYFTIMGPRNAMGEPGCYLIL